MMQQTDKIHNSLNIEHSNYKYLEWQMNDSIVQQHKNLSLDGMPCCLPLRHSGTENKNVSLYYDVVPQDNPFT